MSEDKLCFHERKVDIDDYFKKFDVYICLGYNGWDKFPCSSSKNCYKKSEGKKDE